ncbi:helix-turn-helix domain-containing protein [Streptomyces yatensis]|uniref:helix-turn-helix domain-containing protein n=1 Tax=Streptomyces yatensis TaxID=155177 RepID=UPI003CCEF68E
MDELVDAAESSLHLQEASDDRLRAATDLLREDPTRPATPAELGRAVGASERTLSRLFHTELSMSFHRWRTTLRIHHALVNLTTDHTGRWQKPSADGIELFDLQAVTVTRYRYRGNTTSDPWTHPNPARTAESVESPVLGDGYAAFGERHGGMDRWQHRHHAPCRLNRHAPRSDENAEKIPR